MAHIISAGPFATEGERKAAKALEQLPPDWIVICNKILPQHDRSHEIDFIIIGQHYVFLLDEKSWRGKIYGNDQMWVREDGTSMRSPLTNADYVAKILSSHIRRKIHPLQDAGYFVRSGVLLSLSEHLPQIHDSRAATGIFLLSDVCQHLETLDSQGGSPLVGQFQKAIEKALIDLSPRPKTPSYIGLFHIEDATTLRPGVRLFHATMNDETYDLLVYDLSREPLAKQELYDFYIHEFTALRKLHTTGFVPESMVPFIWSEDFLVLPIVPPTGKSLGALPLPETREEFVQDLQLAATAFKALDQIHTNQVLHRAIGPDTIFVQSGSSPKVVFTNFYAARVGTNTIEASLDALSIDDPYADIALKVGYGYASPETDTFSLGLVFLERLSGVSLSDIRANVESDVIFPLHPRWSSFLSPELSEELMNLFKEFVHSGVKQTSTITAKEISRRFSELEGRLKEEIRENVSEGIVFDNRYKVVRLLGAGAMARTYLVSDNDFESLGLFAVKKYHNPQQVVPQVEAEFRAIKEVKSKYFPDIFDIYGPEHDIHLKMEYIAGPTLQEVETELPWMHERWWTFANDLLNAVELLEQHDLLHRDIKPANIILREDDGRPVLIDFGFAIRQDSTGQIAGTPLYLPPEAFSSDNSLAIPKTSDRYASAVVLFKTLTGFMPFTFSQGQRQLISLDSIADDQTRRVAAVLLKAVSVNPAERPASITQMRQELQMALLETPDSHPKNDVLEEKINFWVDNIRSLYRNSDIGNMNNRGLDTDFVRDTYVQTALDTTLMPAIFEQKPKVVFLSGNPGDGKTAFLEQMQQALRQRHATCIKAIKDNPSGWEWEFEGHIYRSCYDASESDKGLSADQQLSEKLQELEGSSVPTIPLTVLIAINDGRLKDFFVREKQRFSWLARQLDDSETRTTEHANVWIIDLKKRAFVMFPAHEGTSVFQEVLLKLVAKDKWEICNECTAQTVCPLRHNAVALRKTRVMQRLEFLFLLSHLRRQRHTTMRDLRSAIAYIITGNKSCEQIHQAHYDTDSAASQVQFAYWQSVFAPAEKSDELLIDLLPLDPGRFPHPHLDRFFHFHESLGDTTLRGYLFIDKADLPPHYFSTESEWLAALKRRLYFEAIKPASKAENGNGLPKVKWLNLLPYQYARDFVDLLDAQFDAEAVESIRERLALGILRSDGIIEDVPKDKLSVNISASEEQQLVILKQLPLDQFVLRIERPSPTVMIEQLPEYIVLEDRSGTPRLEISLDLFELLMRLANGLRPDAPEFKPLLEDLRLFKDALLLQDTRDLILIENQHRVHLVTQREGKIVRTRLA